MTQLDPATPIFCSMSSFYDDLDWNDLASGQSHNAIVPKMADGSSWNNRQVFPSNWNAGTIFGFAARFFISFRKPAAKAEIPKCQRLNSCALAAIVRPGENNSFLQWNFDGFKSFEIFNCNFGNHIFNLFIKTISTGFQPPVSSRVSCNSIPSRRGLARCG